MTRDTLASLALALATTSAGAAFAAFLTTSWAIEALEKHATRMESQ